MQRGRESLDSSTLIVRQQLIEQQDLIQQI